MILIFEEEDWHKIWNLFKSAKLVITDRLHGMIFCYLTNTPCLVFQNNNHKVRETYEWIKGNKNITLVEEFSQEKIEKFLNQKNFNIGEMLSIANKYDFISNILK